jgi:hypothetical protein
MVPKTLFEGRRAVTNFGRELWNHEEQKEYME